MTDSSADPVSLAIETSCRTGGLALARGDELMKSAAFDASARHAAHLICRLRDVLAEAGLAPTDLDHVYVSAGPGSFTGLRIGVTVARTMAQMLPRLRCVAVPTAAAVAENARTLRWEHLAVLLAAKEQAVYACLFARRGDRILPEGPPVIAAVGDFLDRAPRPLTLTGEGLNQLQANGKQLTFAPPDLRLPTAEGVWRVGRAMAKAGRFTEYPSLVPIYARKPEAIRLWENRHSGRSDL